MLNAPTPSCSNWDLCCHWGPIAIVDEGLAPQHTVNVNLGLGVGGGAQVWCALVSKGVPEGLFFDQLVNFASGSPFMRLDMGFAAQVWVGALVSKVFAKGCFVTNYDRF